ncbi:DNA utilization protein GntX [Variibacter gotjawalensis]|uniref:DNA utilization protein GntX n=1 Tax=Variibacter gotjawalensis TaxID=1333996 RepID=A0A0S3PSR1_9BRAD|nr:ComF family protein [Variibacter gotjawalensis]NIK49300.1 ComF family protein [Variibacter gotjawalensis]RZS51151.1 ComF family protein [Variibacter gotjawalensis]BAT58986.1 DNA utilization protein GntX [Variibacter gotjawalensis]
MDFSRAHALTSYVRRGWSLALGAALPPLCPVCRDPVADPAGLCPHCWSRLSFISRPYCERLGTPFAYDSGPGLLSPEAIAEPPAYNRARAAVGFDDVSRTLVHAFKYGDRMDLAPMLAGWMTRAGAELLADADALVPVPLHWRRLWARRFNQSATLAKRIGAASDRPVLSDVLKRIRATQQQVGLSQAERVRNIQGAFAVPEGRRHAVAGRNLVLVDDVLTSGATVQACARTLMRAGAARVDVLVFARVVNHIGPPI